MRKGAAGSLWMPPDIDGSTIESLSTPPSTSSFALPPWRLSEIFQSWVLNFSSMRMLAAEKFNG